MVRPVCPGYSAALPSPSVSPCCSDSAAETASSLAAIRRPRLPGALPHSASGQWPLHQTRMGLAGICHFCPVFRVDRSNRRRNAVLPLDRKPGSQPAHYRRARLAGRQEPDACQPDSRFAPTGALATLEPKQLERYARRFGTLIKLELNVEKFLDNLKVGPQM